MNAIRASPLPPLPYFNMLTILGVYTFVKERVDVGIFEVGIGGDLDCTNVFAHPAATAVPLAPHAARLTRCTSQITSIGLDHTDLLGDTLPSIAAHKAGIFKPGVKAFTHAEDAPVHSVIHDHAAAVGVCTFVLPPTADATSLCVDRVHSRASRCPSIFVTVSLDARKPHLLRPAALHSCWCEPRSSPHTSPQAEHVVVPALPSTATTLHAPCQRANASIAIACCCEWLRQNAPQLLQQALARGSLEGLHLPFFTQTPLFVVTVRRLTVPFSLIPNASRNGSQLTDKTFP